MEGQNYKQLFDSIKEHAKLEIEYSKLTLAEKMSILLSRAMIVAILLIFGAGVLLLLLWALGGGIGLGDNLRRQKRVIGNELISS